MKVTTFQTHWIHPDWHCQSVYGRYQQEEMVVSSTALKRAESWVALGLALVGRWLGPLDQPWDEGDHKEEAEW